MATGRDAVPPGGPASSPGAPATAFLGLPAALSSLSLAWRRPCCVAATDPGGQPACARRCALVVYLARGRDRHRLLFLLSGFSFTRRERTWTAVAEWVETSSVGGDLLFSSVRRRSMPSPRCAASCRLQELALPRLLLPGPARVRSRPLHATSALVTLTVGTTQALTVLCAWVGPHPHDPSRLLLALAPPAVVVFFTSGYIPAKGQ